MDFGPRVMLLAVCFLQTTLTQRCLDDTWVPYNSYCYYFSVRGKGWIVTSVCPKCGELMCLTEPTSLATLQFLINHAKSIGCQNVPLGINLKYEPSRRKVTTRVDVRPVSYTVPWDEGFPDNDGKSSCIYLVNGKFRSRNCRDETNFICRKKDFTCTSTSCLNGGRCSVETCVGVVCDCTGTGYYGYRCEKMVDACTSQPCQNGGACLMHVQRYSCRCNIGYEGIYCQVNVDECASTPCQHAGNCTDGVNVFTCKCPEPFYGTVCDKRAPSELFYTCEEWVPEFQDINCTCSAMDSGTPKARLGWNLNRDKMNLQPYLVLERLVRKDDRIAVSYTCQATWIRPNGEAIVITKSYTPKVAYGPTEQDTYIEGVVYFRTSGIETTPLRCFSNNTNPPQTLVEWKGISCIGGNFARNCTFRPDPSLGTQVSLTCILVNSADRSLRAWREHKMKLKWDEKPSVRILQVEGTSHMFATNKTGASLNLTCQGFGDPRPDVVDVFLIRGRNSSLPEGGTKLKEVDSNTTQYYLQKRYKVKSPATCQGVDTYRCFVSKQLIKAPLRFITVYANCTRADAARLKLERLPIIFGVIGGLAPLASVLYFIVEWRRRKKKKQALVMEALRSRHRVEYFSAEDAQKEDVDLPDQDFPTETDNESVVNTDSQEFKESEDIEDID
ncbi:hypothetical protein BaRGS_00034187 [Batillaria attramentaria]|uniref:Uncharacterized protein n=1 Tax=Batillaria attramentaria TaxID=370345 RepID=A0ABD0JIQ3_9CAEN